MKIRLNRYLSLCGLSSRRKAELLIENGEIFVNGQVEVKLQKVIDTGVDEVLYQNRKIKPQEFEYYKMNKPRFCLTTMSDNEKRKTVKDLLEGFEVKLFPVGRLDYDTEGLLLFTNDGKIAHKISHPSFLVQKTYLVHLKSKVSKALYSKMKKGANLRDGFLMPEKIELINSNEDESLLKIEIHEGRNHIIKNFFKFFGIEVSKLKRISVGPIKLGELEPGQIVKLDYNELEELKKIF
ncbi:rRNA pseudouridine synthase [bacterium]|nr:rRNA pseudouridine synthase [bacterium]|tara:strand:- start:1118 stop:1831 length:714 start_codon:yes stop_codon:yes gene_type:complete